MAATGVKNIFIDPFNQTKVELKSFYAQQAKVDANAFNQTKVELKF